MERSTSVSVSYLEGRWVSKRDREILAWGGALSLTGLHFTGDGMEALRGYGLKARQLVAKLEFEDRDQVGNCWEWQNHSC